MFTPKQMFFVSNAQVRREETPFGQPGGFGSFYFRASDLDPTALNKGKSYSLFFYFMNPWVRIRPCRTV